MIALTVLLLGLLAPTLTAQSVGAKGGSRDRRGASRDPDDAAPARAPLAMSERSGPDEPDEMEALTRELWRFARRTPYEAAVRHAQAAQSRRAKPMAEITLPTGWRIAPAGTQVEVGRLPYEAVLADGGVVVLNTGWYPALSENPEISLVDARTARVLKSVFVPSLYPSAAVGPAGSGAIFVSGGSSDSVFQLDRELNVTRRFAIGGYVGPIARLDATHLAVASLVAPDSSGESGPGKLVVLNTSSGRIESEVPAGYFPTAMVAVAGKLYVALVGEHRVLVYDVRSSTPRLLRSVATGRAPQSLCTDSGRVYVVNSASDDVTALSVDNDAVVARYAVRFPGTRDVAAKYGAAPTSCAVAGGRLYVSAAGMNAVAVFDRASGGARDVEPVGLIPTGWYPTKVLGSANGLAILSAKGIRGRRPNPDGPQAIADTRTSGPDYILSLLHGSLALLPDSEIAPQLATWTRQVASGAPLYNPREGLRVPIRHVFYIVRENRSYDQVLGDLGRGDGDSSLTLFGEKLTPVAHQLARQFVTLDHFFADGEISVLGHSYTTSGYASPFLEWLGNTAYASRYRGYPFGTVPGVYSPAYLWDALEAKQVSYRIYGEPYYLFTRLYRLITDRYGAESALARRFYAHSMSLADSVDRGSRFTQLGTPVAGASATRTGALRLLADSAFLRGMSRIFTGDAALADAVSRDPAFRDGVADWLTHYMLGYPTWNLAFSDLDRVALWRQDFAAALKENRVPAFSYLWLPNDHTAGVNPAFPNPYQLVAQNDAALGELVETISHSPIWRESVIIVEEDDAQNGPDHIDGTRTVGLLAGPWVKRDAVVSDHYDQLSALRTVELLLGLDPLNLGDALAVPMFGAFTTQADMRPFTPPAPSGYLMPGDREKLGGGR